MDTRFRLYEELESDGKSEERCIAFYGPVVTYDKGKGYTRCVAARNYGLNPFVENSELFAEYEKKFCKPITEQRARELHPRLFEYLDGCEGFSTIVVQHRPHEGKSRLRFEACRVLDTTYPRTNKVLCEHRATLLGTDSAIAEIRAHIMAHPDNFSIEIDILPALPKDFQGAAIWNSLTKRTEEEVKAFLTGQPLFC